MPKAIFGSIFLQGESVAESGSIISHDFRTYFSLYVVPRGLITVEHKLLQFVIPRLVANSTLPNRIVSLDIYILCDERSLGKGNKLNIPWLYVCILEKRKT